MGIALLAVPTYADPGAREWQPDMRWSTSYLRSHGVTTRYAYCATTATVDELASATESLDVAFVDAGEDNEQLAIDVLERVAVRWPAALRLIGGIPATLDPERLLGAHPVLDGCVLGEREGTLLELDRRRGPIDASSLAATRGLRTRQATTSRYRDALPDLDELGLMATDGLDELCTPEPLPVGYLKSSRGCWARCAFCGVSDMFRRTGVPPWRGRSPAAIVAELRMLVDTYGITRFVFQDDNFIGPGSGGQQRAIAIADEIIAGGLHIEFAAAAMLASLRRAPLKRLHAAGLRQVGVSVESMNPESLNLLSKGHRPDQVYPALDMLDDLGLRAEVNLIFFDPCIDLAGVRRNLELLGYLRDSRSAHYSDAFPFNPLRIFSWSRIAGRVAAAGLCGPDGSWAYRDDKVARLAEFTRDLESRAGLSFKTRTLIDTTMDPAAETNMARAAPALRHWIGLSIMPRYLAAACDLLENAADDEAAVGLSEMTEGFAAEMGQVRAQLGFHLQVEA